MLSLAVAHGASTISIYGCSGGMSHASPMFVRCSYLLQQQRQSVADIGTPSERSVLYQRCMELGLHLQP